MNEHSSSPAVIQKKILMLSPENAIKLSLFEMIE
jgi:hypothetical protein